MIVPGVGVMSREEAIEGVAGGQRWDSVEMSDDQIVEITDTVAVLSYEARAVRKQPDAVYHAFVGSVYAMRSGEWKLAFHQQTIAE